VHARELQNQPRVLKKVEQHLWVFENCSSGRSGNSRKKRSENNPLIDNANARVTSGMSPFVDRPDETSRQTLDIKPGQGEKFVIVAQKCISIVDGYARTKLNNAMFETKAENRSNNQELEDGNKLARHSKLSK